MTEETDKKPATPVGEAEHVSIGEEQRDPIAIPIEEEAVQDAYHVHLSWRSWVCRPPSY